MTDEDETLEPQRQVTSIRATQCLKSFKQCLLRTSSVYHPREFSVVEDQMAKLSTWVASLEVFAPEQASTDHRLRFAQEVQNAVVGLLESLDYRIRACSDVLGMLSNFAAFNAQNGANGRLERCFVDIEMEISRLNKFSNTIRRASKEVHVLNTSNFQIIDDNGNSVEPLLLARFENRIRDQFPNVSKIIQQRLARTMVLRQKRILHMKLRQVNPSIPPQKPCPDASITLPVTQPGIPSAHRDPKGHRYQMAVDEPTTIANYLTNDLDPYVCLFENCKEADLLYSCRDEWLSHLHEHSKIWRCLSHRELGPFSTSEEYIRHTQQVHNTKLNDTQLRALARKNARTAGKLFLSCPLCDKDVANADGRRLEDHIAEHLTSLALESLPRYQDETLNDTGAEKDSIGSSQPQSRRTASHLVDADNTPESRTDHIMKKHPDLSPGPLKRPRAQSMDRSLSSGSNTSRSSSIESSRRRSPSIEVSTIPSLSSTTSRRYPSIPIVSISQPNASEVTGRSDMSKSGKPVSKKARGWRTGPLYDGMRELLTDRRSEPTICIGCKIANVMCDGREDGKDCSRCATIHSDVSKPLACAPTSFFKLIQQGSTILLGFHIIYPLVSSGLRQQIQLPFDIDIRRLIRSIDRLKESYDSICVYGMHGMLYNLDLDACLKYIHYTCSPLIHPFKQFIDGLKSQEDDAWKTCIRNRHSQQLNKRNICDVLLALDDMAPWVTYGLRSKPTILEHSSPHGTSDDGTVTILYPDNEFQKGIIILAAQLTRIIGRKLELQFYDYLEKTLANPHTNSKIVLDIGRIIMSLRRRLAQWPKHSHFLGPSNNETDVDKDGNSLVDRIRKLCYILYVYFCHLKQQLSPNDQRRLQTMRVLYPDSGEAIEESFPRYNSIDGFEEWLRFQTPAGIR